MLSDVPKVIVDYKNANEKLKASIDTGCWTKIFKSKLVYVEPKTVGLTL